MVRFRLLVLIVTLLAASGVSSVNGQSTSTMTVGTPTIDANGVKYYPVTSVYQGSQPQTIRVLQPTNPAAGVPPRVLYVLPVDAGVDTPKSPWGDGLDQLRQLDVPNTYNMTLIAPSFNYEPWYGDDVLDPTHRMESFIIDDLVPFGDTFLPANSVPQRYLIGFSKAGNGVLLLMLRHPGVFNAGAAWDAPAQLNTLSAFAALPMNFGTQANLTTYNIPALVTSNAQPFQAQNRLWISGDQADWTADMDQLNQQMTTAGIQHTWVAGPQRVHSWTSGWMQGAATDLATNATQTAPANGSIPPALTGGLPAGILGAGTTQATLSVITDQNATCRYSTTAGVAYASMANTFSSTGGTSHSTPVTGLQNNGSYNYYVRCKDGSGNTDAADYAISFSVDTTAILLTNGGNLTLNAGAATGNSSAITVTPSGSFTGAVNLICAVTTGIATPTSPATCSMAPNSVNIAGTAAAMAAVIVNTTDTTSPGVYTVTVNGFDVATGKISGGTGLTVTVNAPAPAIALANGGNITVSQGAATGNSTTISIAPSGGFTGAVNLTCAVATSLASPTDPPTCSLSASSVTISGATPATATLTVNTTANSAALDLPLRKFLAPAGGAALAMVLFFGVPARRRAWRTLFSLLAVVVVAGGIGCGGGNSSGGGGSGGGNTSGGGGSVSGTTAGAYTVTVTGTDAATGKIAATTVVTVTVNAG